MNKIIIFLISFFLIILGSSNLIRAHPLEEDQPEIETNIVLLTLLEDNHLVENDPFFELYYFPDHDYILLPANLLSPYLAVEMNFQRELGLLTLSKNNLEVKIDLSARKYLGHENWDQEKIIIFGGEFYLSKSVFEYLTDYQISWSNSLQELTITGDFTKDDFSTDEFESESKKKQKLKDQDQFSGEKLAGFTLNSVHYRVGFELSEDDLFESQQELTTELNFYGRFKNWAYSLNNDFNYNLKSNNFDYKLDNLELKSCENNNLLIIGDYDFNFAKTIVQNEMQGIYYRIPEKLSYKLIPYTEIEIPVELDDEVSIYVNNKFVHKEIIKATGNYQFKNIELRLNYLNKIEVVKLSAAGEEIKELKYLAGSTTILQSGIKETEFLMGRYRNTSYSDDNDWEGNFIALRSNYALNRRLTFHTETAYLTKQDIDRNILTTVTGISLRAADRTVINLDFLAGGESDNLQLGSEISILYALINGYCRAVYLNVPPEVEDYLTQEEGTNISLNFKFDLNKRFSMQSIVGQHKTLVTDDIEEIDYYILRLIDNPDWRHYRSFSLYYQKELSYFPFLEYNNELYGALANNKRPGIGLAYNLYGNSYRIAADLKHYRNNIEFTNEQSPLYKQLLNESTAEVNIYKRLGENLLFSLGYDGEKDKYDDQSYDYERSYDGQLKLSLGERTAITLSAERTKEDEDELNEDNENIADLETIKSLSLNYYWNSDYSIKAELKDYSSTNLIDYQSFYLGGSYYFPVNPGSITLFGEYILPVEGENGISFGISYDKVFTNKNELTIELAREYNDYQLEGYENYLTITYSQAFAFLGDIIIKDNFNDRSPRSIVAGYVYLDQNYNGIMDAGEKRLNNIPMRLGNMISRTNKDGLFIFKPYFNDLYLLDFDYRNLIADYTPVTKKIMLKIKDNQSLNYNFALTINGSVAGKVFIDKNANNIKDQNEEYLAWVGLEIPDLKQKDYTNQGGNFYFENVPLGTHILKILPESLPAGMRPLNGYEYKIFITEAQLDYHNLDLAIVYGN